MKKTLAFFLAMLLLLTLVCAFALAPPVASRPDPLQIKGIMVTDAAGYAAPYTAVDEADPFVDTQAAYIVVAFALAARGDSDFAAFDPAAIFRLDITSQTLDLSYAGLSGKWVKVVGGTITTNSITATAATTDISKASVRCTMSDLFSQEDVTAYYYYTFIGVTKPAVTGEIRAVMQSSPASFAGTPASLTCFGDGAAKYKVVRTGENGGSYAVYNGSGTYLFTYVQDGSKFLGIGNPSLLAWTYDGKLVDTVTQRDYADIVAQANAFFGFNFAYDSAAGDQDFIDKAGGNPASVSDTYNYIVASVVLGDDYIPLPQTGDFTGNVVLVLAASALLALGALFFVQKARL